MKKPSTKIRQEIAALQDQLKAAERREAERIGRVALKAGLADIEIEEASLLSAFEEIARRHGGGTTSFPGDPASGDAKSEIPDRTLLEARPHAGGHIETPTPGQGDE